MILKRLEIYGFKSFADKIYMSFGDGITTIVGPNGSGKSNIADAIRWVLGEQSAKSLRGSKMEDIIFSGTQVRKALGFAEVSITLDNSDLMLSLDYSEVTISRRVFRSGESEYSINKNTCRLKDITELLMDTGIGKEGYSIIGQGRIDEILSNRSEDRRYIFEEAAGIVKYKTRRHEAEKKLDKAHDNLLRVDDIILELEQQLTPLKEQSITAKKFLNMRDELKHLEINQFLHQYDRHSKKITNIKEQIEQLSIEIDNRRAEYVRKEENRDLKSLEIDKLKKAIDELQQERFNLINKAERIKGEQNLHQEKLNQIDKDNKRLEEEIVKENNEIDNNEKEIENLLLDIDKKKKILDISNEELNKLLEKISELDHEYTKKQKSIDESKGSIIDVSNKISNYRESLTRYETIKSNLDTRLKQISDLHTDKEKKLKELRNEQSSLHNNIMLTKQQVNKEKSKKQSKEKLISDTKQTLVAMDREIQTSKQQIEGMRSRHKLLEDMKKGYEGFNKSVREILKICKKDNKLADKVCGALASLINVPKRYEVAVETVLGFSLQHIVTEHENDAKYLIEYLKSNNLGRATFLPISSIRSRQLNNNEKRVLKMEGCLGIASEFVKCHAKYKKIIENLLGRVAIAENLETAIQMARSFSHSFRIVTISGDVINPGGSMTGGSKAIRSVGLLSRNRELIELKRMITEQDKKLNDLMDEQETLYLKHRENKDSLELLENEIKDISLRLSKEEETYNNNLAIKDQLESEIVALDNEQGNIEHDLVEINSFIDDTNANLSKLESENANISEAAKESEEYLKIITSERENLNDQGSDIRVKVATYTQEIQALSSQCSRLENEITKRKENIDIKIMQLKTNKSDKEKIEEDNKDIEIEITNARVEADRLQNQIQIEKDKCTEEEKLLSEIGVDIKNSNQSIDDLTRKRHQFEVQLSRMEAELENYQNNMWKEYEITYSNAVLFKDVSLSYTRIKQEIQKLKTNITALGDVNVNAVDEYRKINDRYTFLSEQRDDLLAAKEDLKTVIKDITITMEKRFKEEFAIINNYFGETFSELFGGGSAQLVLEDEQDILSCGIEIIAQPPGKKLQSLSLLSGGEKALTAIAILFAILRHKPTPFCVLDEIDAALDESNVYQFSSFIKDLSNSQFIIITHRKGTMEVSDVMYGIAMEEKGISKLISVKFEDMVS